MVSTLAELVVGGVVAAALVWLALLRPTIVLVFAVFMDATGINVAIKDDTGFSPFKPILGLVALALFVMWRQKKLRFGWSPVLTAVLILYAAWLVTITVSADPTVSKTLFADYAVGLLYFVLIYVLVLSTGSWREMLYAMVGGLAALGALTVFHQVVLHNVGSLHGLSNVPLVKEDGALTPRHSGTAYDVNFWGRTMVFMVPFALTLWANHRKFFKLFWLASTFGLLGGLFLTQSRGGFLAVLPAIVVWFLLAGRRYRRMVVYFPLVLAVAVPFSGVGGRLATLLQLSSSSNQAAQDPSLVTRARFAHAAWKMFLDKPVMGHGMGTYGTLFPWYDRYSDLGDPVDIVVAAHNFYLEQAADGGIMLLTAWGIFFGTIFFLAWRIWHNARELRKENEQRLAVGIAAALTGWMAASAFLHLSDIRVMLAVAAITASVDLRLRWQVAAQVNVPVDAEPPVLEPAPVGAHPRVVFVRVALPLALLSLLGGGYLVGQGAPTTWSAEQELRVAVTSDNADGMTSYETDLITRGQLVPSFTAIADSRDAAAVALKAAGLTSEQGRGVAVMMAVSRQGGGIMITVTAPDQETAEKVATAAGQVAAARVAALHTVYYLQQPRRPVPEATHPGLAIGAGLLGLAVALPILAFVFRRRRDDEEIDPLAFGDDSTPSFDRLRAMARV